MKFWVFQKVFLCVNEVQIEMKWNAKCKSELSFQIHSRDEERRGHLFEFSMWNQNIMSSVDDTAAEFWIRENIQISILCWYRRQNLEFLSSTKSQKSSPISSPHHISFLIKNQIYSWFRIIVGDVQRFQQLRKCKNSPEKIPFFSSLSHSQFLHRKTTKMCRAPSHVMFGCRWGWRDK